MLLATLDAAHYPAYKVNRFTSNILQRDRLSLLVDCHNLHRGIGRTAHAGIDLAPGELHCAGRWLHPAEVGAAGYSAAAGVAVGPLFCSAGVALGYSTLLPMALAVNGGLLLTVARAGCPQAQPSGGCGNDS